MLAPLVTAAALSACPSTSDRLAAFSDLTSPAGSPVAAAPSVRARLAAVDALHALGGLDADAGDHRWFTLAIWESDHNYARKLAARVRECPPLAEGAWVPPAAWFRSEADAAAEASLAWMRRAIECRERSVWEADRAEELLAWARYMEAVSGDLTDRGVRLRRWGGDSWQAPRRVVLAEIRDHIGPAAWAARRWPE